MAGLKNIESFMLEALKEARKAYGENEVPVGAVLVYGGKIISRAHNQPIGRCSPVAHAEILALQKAAKKLGNYRLNGASLYVTVEPCPMCAGALVNARVKEVVFGCYDSRAGACGSVMDVARNKKLNHRLSVTGGVLEVPCRDLMRKFFIGKRVKCQR